MAQGGGEMIYADELAMMKHCFGPDWPREITHTHEIAEQVYAQWTGLVEAGK